MWVLLLGIIFSPGCANGNRTLVKSQPSPDFSPQRVTKIAVLVENRSRSSYGDDGIMRQIEDSFVQSLLSKGYRVATRSDLAAVQREIKFQHSGWTDQDAVELGRLVNASAVLIASVNRSSITRDNESYLQVRGRYVYGLTNSVSLGARLVGVEGGDILWIGKFDGAVEIPNENDAPIAISKVADVVAQSFPARNGVQQAADAQPTVRQ